MLVRLDRDNLQFFFAAALVVELAGLVLLLATPTVRDRLGTIKGRDFLQFHVAGRIVLEGDADRLYDIAHFLDVQCRIAPPDESQVRYFPLYPPWTALLMTPFAALPYGMALACWWVLQAGAFSLAIWLSLRNADSEWRDVWTLALASFVPVFLAMLNGQLTGTLLLALVVGMRLGCVGREFLGGLVLAMLVIKPQFTAFAALWLVGRRDLRGLAGFALGAFGLVALCGLVLGWSVLEAFRQHTAFLADLRVATRFTPTYEQALAGVLINLFGPDFDHAARLTHAALALAVLAWLASRHGWLQSAPCDAALVVVYVLFALPYLGIYDLALLILPLAELWRKGRFRAAGWLYAFASLSPLYGLLGGSLMPVVLVGTLVAMMRPSADATSRASGISPHDPDASHD
jgi:hypothetical protein